MVVMSGLPGRAEVGRFFRFSETLKSARPFGLEVNRKGNRRARVDEKSPREELRRSVGRGREVILEGGKQPREERLVEGVNNVDGGERIRPQRGAAPQGVTGCREWLACQS